MIAIGWMTMPFAHAAISLVAVANAALVNGATFGDSGTPPRPLFRDITSRALPGVVTTCGSPAKDYIIEVNGGGVLLDDFDGDGKVDIVIVDGSTLERIAKREPGFPPRLYLGQGDGTFASAGESWEIAAGRWGMGGTAGDLNGDGWPDLVLTEWGPDRVFLNDAGKGFTEITAKAGLTGDAWGTSAALFDYDRDGHLDLVVVNYLAFDPTTASKPGSDACRWKNLDVMCGPEGLTPVHDQLYRGNGDGTFREVTAQAKFRPKQPAFGLGVITLDYDNDGDTDLYVANDSMPNHLWDNQGDGTFTEVAFRAGVSHDVNGKEQASMGIACGDWNGDGRADLFVTNFSGESKALYLSVRERAFRERSSGVGLGGPSIPMLGWGTTMADFDLDGDLDLSALYGHVYPQADRPGTDTSYAQIDHMYRNIGDGRFAAESLSDAGPKVSRASAAADLDGDGDLDIVGVQVEGAPRVLLNETEHGAKAHWLRVRLRSKSPNRFALGARVTVEWDGGTRWSEIRTAGGFQASVPPEAHFGLGTVDRLKRVLVRWPSGREQSLADVAVDRVLTIHEEVP
jgi:hypothetical protein